MLTLSNVSKMQRNFQYFIALLFFTSCGTGRNITYFSDLKESETYTSTISNKVDPVIQPDDLLSITLSSLNPESNVLFNNGILQGAGNSNSAGSGERLNEGYLVDKSGTINFPVLGTLKLAGLTKAEATQLLTTKITQYVKNPIINIRFLNFKVTVVGEVNRPATISVPTERINVVEALGLAGDMTIYGKRTNVLIIREKDGVRNTARINLSNKASLNSPYYYLQQNDIVYVEAEKAKALQASSTNYYLPLVSAVASIVSVLLFAFR